MRTSQPITPRPIMPPPVATASHPSLPATTVQGVYHLRGGVERYMKTFPEGGLWKGKNYTFDRRMVQVPTDKPEEKLEEDIESKCACCDKPYDVYRGSYKCHHEWCNVPVIVCAQCDAGKPTKVECPLCKTGYEAPQMDPDYETMAKKRARKLAEEESGGKKKKKRKTEGGAAEEESAARVFVGKMPLAVDITQLKAALAAGLEEAAEFKGQVSPEPVKLVHWLADKTTGAFYGSAFVEMSSPEIAERLVAAANRPVASASASAGKAKAKTPKQDPNGPFRINGRRLRVNLAPPKEGDDAWPPKDFQQRDRPPIM